MKLRSLPAVLACALPATLAFAQTSPAPSTPPAKPATPAPSAVALAAPAAAPNEVRPIPPAGIAIPDSVKAELTAGAAQLAEEIKGLRIALAGRPDLLPLLPDVEIFHKSVDWAVRYGEFFDAKQFDAAKRQLALGHERAQQLREGSAPWTKQTGLVVRGYRSAIDGSIQPYGLVIPDSWKPGGKPMRLDFWLHGRGEKLSELAFLEDRMKSRGEFAPETAIVAHLYERFCNANKFAGEADLFETLRSVSERYPIDQNRIVVRGFSMGGAGCWQYAAHHTGTFVAAAPGAGFAETAEFLHVFDPGKIPPPWWEQVLWRWYDCTIYARNLSNTTVVAYSGEIDKQKQAADIMEKYMAQEGLTLTHIIGPGVPHKYHPDSKPKIEELVTAAAEKGEDVCPPEVKFTTYTPIYHQMKWVNVEGQIKGWERSDVDAAVKGDRIEATTKNVSAIAFVNPVTGGTVAAEKLKQVTLDGDTVPAVWSFGRADFHRENGHWLSGPDTEALRKRPGLCGPVDHAFTQRFTFVRPTGQPLNSVVGAWAKAELDHATSFWRQVYRGDAPITDDQAVTDEEIQNSNLVLWGDPSSNALIAKVIAKLPIQWSAAGITVGKTTYPAGEYAPILIFPNPLNPKKYEVLNSGVTFREKALLNNSDQTPKLPDWAIVDLRTAPGPEAPGNVIDAGFFDEHWKLQ